MDMFYNYDNNIDKKEYPIIKCPPNHQKILESNPTLSLVLDAKGNEIGIAARHKSAFSLYFMMDGCVENSSIEELVCNSSINFQIIDYWHKPIVDKMLSAEDCYIGDDTIRIDIDESDAEKLKQETYNMKLTLFWPDGKYELYSDCNGFLTIK